MSCRLILPDVHVPFHDVHLTEAWLEFAAALDPEGVDILGDVLDCYTISRFDKNPARKASFQDEVDTARLLLERIRETCSRSDIRFTEGNHETRLRTMLWGRAKELADIRGLSIPALLHLGDLGIHYYEPHSPYVLNGVWIVHGDVARKANWSMSYGGSGAQAVAKRVGGSVIMGHTHQMAHVSYRTWGALHEGYECGCICQFDMDYIVGIPQWQQGWGVLHLIGKSAYHVEFVRCVDRGSKRALIYRGEVIAKLPPAKKHVHVTPRVLVACDYPTSTAAHAASLPVTPLGRGDQTKTAGPGAIAPPATGRRTERAGVKVGKVRQSRRPVKKNPAVRKRRRPRG